MIERGPIREELRRTVYRQIFADKLSPLEIGALVDAGEKEARSRTRGRGGQPDFEYNLYAREVMGRVGITRLTDRWVGEQVSDLLENNRASTLDKYVVIMRLGLGTGSPNL